MQGDAVLVVEDDEAVREAVRGILEEHGYPTACAANGQEALKILSEPPRPRLILLDLMMPVMNGWEVLRSLRDSATLARIPVVVLSALVGRDLPTDVPVVKKPFSEQTLLRLVEEYGS